MNGPTFRMVREGLGLPAQWVADQLGVSKRALNYWENAASEPPPHAVDWLHKMEEWARSHLREMKEAYRNHGYVNFKWFMHWDRPLSYHAVIFGRLRCHHSSVEAV